MNWLHEQYQRERLEDLGREAEQRTLVRALMARKPQRPRIYNRVATSLGRWMVIWGWRLQQVGGVKG